MSILNPQHKHLFIHVPRTGGTSMESYAFVGGSGHKALIDYIGRIPDGYFIWGFVRNPYDRAVSSFHHLKQMPEGSERGMMSGALAYQAARKHDTFGRYIMELGAAGFTGVMTCCHTTPQWLFLDQGCSGRAVDFVGRYEEIVRDWRIVCGKIGVDAPRLRRLRRSCHGPWRKHMTPEAVKIINRVYHQDFIRFGYEIF
jgi:hypothetical protein